MLSPINWPSLNKIEIYIRKKKDFENLPCVAMRYRTVHRIPSESISVVGRVATEATRPDRRLTGRTPPRWLALSEPAAVRQIRRRFLRCHRRTPPSPHRKEHRFVGLVGVFVMWRRWIALHFWLSFFSITRTFMVFIFFLENTFVHCSHHLIDDEGIGFDQIGAQRDTTRHCRFGEDQSKRH